MEPSFVNAPTVVPLPGEEVDTSWLVGRRVGPGGIFELQARAASGGMGEIWAAWMHDPRNPRRVAIKIIRPGLHSDLSRELFHREIEMHDRVRDVKGVVPLIDRGSFDVPGGEQKIYFFAMEWITSARSLIQACKGLTLDRKLAIFMRVCEALDVVHKRAVVHCDIKPENILVDEEGTPWLTDFGLAISTRTHERKHTGWDIGSLRGTWSYMAPEQCDDRCDPYSFTPALDVYSLGVSFYQCVTGRLPYAEDPATLGDKTKAASMISMGTRVPRRIGGHTLPPSLRAALQRALSPRPEERFVDAGQLGAELRPLVRGGRVREWALALVLVVVCLLAGEYPVAWMFNAAPVYGAWYARVSGLVENKVRLHDVAMVSMKGEVRTMSPQLPDVQSHTDLERAAQCGAPVASGAHKRELLAATLDRLKELGVRVVLIDLYFSDPAEPDATTRLIRAIQDFEGPKEAPRGWVCIGMRDWRPHLGETLIEPGLAAISDHAQTLSMELALDTTDVINEVAFAGDDGLVLGSAALMAAAAWRDPLANLRLDVATDLLGGSGTATVSYRQRTGAASVTRPIELAVQSHLVKVARQEGQSSRANESYPTLGEDDRLYTLRLPAIPSAEDFDRVSVNVCDLWTIDAAKLRAEFDGKVVILGDQYTHGETRLDSYALPGQSREIWGMELQATFTQAVVDAIRLGGSFAVNMSASIANFGMPLMTIVGVGGGWCLVRRRPTKAWPVIGMVTLGLLVVSCGLSVMGFVWLLWMWNPFLMPAAFAVAAGLGVLVPWSKV